MRGRQDPLPCDPLAILETLLDEALPVNWIAKRVGASEGSTSKRVTMLFRNGVLERGLGGLYKIRPAFREPSSRIVKLGRVQIHF